MKREQFIPVCKVAEILNVSTKMVGNLIRKGDLPAIRVSSEYRVKTDDFQSFIEQSRVKTN